MKKEKGAITLFVLIAILFFIIVLINLLIVTANRANKQIETTQQAIDIYGKSVDEIEDLYKSYFGDKNVIPIYTAEQLQTLATLKTGETKNVTINEAGGKIYTFSLDKVYVLRNDIDASIIDNWTAIGTQTDPFNGILEGANYEIREININSSDEENGLFGFVGENGKIRNLGVTNGTISGNNIILGGIAGTNVGIIENCYNTNEVECKLVASANGLVGGIAGTNAGIIENCWNSGTITSASNCVGGIAGGNSGEIRSCYNEGNVSAETVSGVGGIVGYQPNSDAIVESCYNEGEILAKLACGGVVGDCINGSISKSYNTGNVEATSGAGGVAGICLGSIEGCYSIGTVTGNSYVGGIVGELTSTEGISHCYYLEGTYTGGINGADVVGQAEARTSSHMRSAAFVQELGETNWKIIGNLNDGYPVLAWQE